MMLTLTSFFWLMLPTRLRLRRRSLSCMRMLAKALMTRLVVEWELHSIVGLLVKMMLNGVEETRIRAV